VKPCTRQNTKKNEILALLVERETLTATQCAPLVNLSRSCAGRHLCQLEGLGKVRIARRVPMHGSDELHFALPSATVYPRIGASEYRLPCHTGTDPHTIEPLTL
jgi:predicted ArsR family transcriptional regulator